MNIKTLQAINTMVREETARRMRLGLDESEATHFTSRLTTKALSLVPANDYDSIYINGLYHAIRNDISKKI